MTLEPPHPLLDILAAQAPAFGPELGRDAYRRGLAVTAPDGTTRPIPITATPVILDGAEIQRRVQLSADLSSAALKMARWMLEGPRQKLLLSALSPLERQVAERTHRAIRRLATTRVDYFVSDRPWALEINATIPAMQGYSDVAAGAFIEGVGRHAGMAQGRIASLVEQNGSNARALYRALLEAYALERGGRPERIALLCRRNDAQLTEQLYLARRFSDLGTEAEVVYPDELSGEDAVRARGRRFDLVYRHLFVRRLEETPSAYVVELFGEAPGRRAVVLNPPASQVEVKTTFAMLSQASADADLARAARLTDAELAAIAQAIPWTRLFRRGPATGPGGEDWADLVAPVAACPERYVVKRAWDYGGKAVFVGPAASEPAHDERVRAAYGMSLPWPELCARAAEDPLGGGFVVQELVSTTTEPHVLCSETGVTRTRLYVDFSAYASVGLASEPGWGGVCRGSPSRIVNIVGGGGVLPLITSEVADALLAAVRARPPR